MTLKNVLQGLTLDIESVKMIVHLDLCCIIGLLFPNFGESCFKAFVLKFDKDKIQFVTLINISISHEYVHFIANESESVNFKATTSRRLIVCHLFTLK